MLTGKRESEAEENLNRKIVLNKVGALFGLCFMVLISIFPAKMLAIRLFVCLHSPVDGLENCARLSEK